jgi:signal transduction histidine kinase
VLRLSLPSKPDEGIQRRVAKALEATNEGYQEYRKAVGKLADEFREAVGKAMRRGDADADPVVTKTCARMAREGV